MRRSSAPAPPAQQIVYTGPVYQLQPAVEVRHMGNAIHYRYASPYGYDDAPPVDYAVYQEYAEAPHRPYAHAERHPHSDAHAHRHAMGDDVAPPPHREPSYYRPRSPDGVATRYASFEREYPAPARAYRRAGLPAAYAPAHAAHGLPVHSALPPPSDPFVAPGAERYATQHHARRPPPPHQLHDPYLSYVSYAGPTYDSMHAGYNVPHQAPDLQSYAPRATPYPAQRERPLDRRAFERAHVARESRTYIAHKEDQEPRAGIMPRRRAFEHEDDSSREDELAEAVSSGPRRPKKRERLSRVGSGRTMSSGPASDADMVDDGGGDEGVSNRYSQYRKEFHESSPEQDLPSKPDQAALRAARIRKEARMRAKGRVGHATSARKAEEGYARDSLPRKKRRLKTENSLVGDARPKAKREKSKSPVSIEDGSVRDVCVKNEPVKESEETSSCNDSDIIIIVDDDDSGTVSEREGTSSMDDEGARRRERERERYRRSLIARAADPDEPYPKTLQEFSGIPPTAIGDMLQLWEFVTAFTEALRLSSFKLRHLEQAIVHKDRSTLLDACITRLVRSILTDKDLADELGVADSVVKAVHAKGSKNLTANILASLHHVLSFESDEVYDEFLLSTVNKLETSSDKWAFYRVIEPAGKLRILRELVDYAIMTDKIRKCVTDSMEHAEEEKKKAREENAANRKKLELQIKDLKAELLEYRTSNGLLDVPADSDREKSVLNGTKDTGGTDDNTGDSSKEEAMSRKEKLLAVQKEKKEEEERRAKEKVAEGFIIRIDKLKANLKTLKNMRLRNRTSACAREGDVFDSSVPAPSMPFAAPHEDPVRTHPIGTDRDDRRYWFFEGCGRIWIEDTNSGEWCTLNTPEGLEGLVRWLSNARREEQQLKKRIRQRKELILSEMTNEEKNLELEEAEAQEAQESATEVAPRYTRAGRKRAEKAQKVKAKTKRTGTFLDYRNLVK